jgi:cytochrome c peroxidase
LWNVAHKKQLFWDGRRQSLEAQAVEPLLEPKELGRAPDEVAAELATIPQYAALFAAAFPKDAAPASAKNLARAIAAFERGFSSRRAPYDRYVDDDAGALDAETLRGMDLFAEAKCATCHVPPLFDSPRFANRGIGDGADRGRFEVSAKSADDGAFGVPTLRNTRDSEPYFHDGSVQSLRDAVAHEVARSIADGQSRALAEDEIDAIARFLDKALTDRTEEPDRPEAVPSGLAVPKDGFRIPR